MISIQGAVHAIILLIVAGIIWWLIDYVGLPEPFNKVARIILAVAAVLVVIGILLSLAGYQVFSP